MSDAPTHIDEYQERSRPVTVHPPKFSPDVSPEMQHFARELTSSFNEEASKTWQMRREMERVDRIGSTVFRLTSLVDQWAADTQRLLVDNAKICTQLATLSERMLGLSSSVAQLASQTSKTLDELRRLENKTYDNENDISLLQALNAAMERRLKAFEESHALHGSRIAALETVRLVAASEQVGQQKLITKGRALGGLAYTVGVIVAAKWNWFVHLFQR